MSRFTPGLHSRHAMLSRLCREAKASNAPALPIFRAALAGEIDLFIVGTPQQPWPAVPVALAKLPVVVLVSDDPRVGVPLGPFAWHSAPSMRCWAHRAVVHGSGGTVAWPYDFAVDAAKATGRVLVVETGSEHAEQWDAYLPAPCLVIIPPSSGVHPVTERAA